MHNCLGKAMDAVHVVCDLNIVTSWSSMHKIVMTKKLHICV